LANSRKDHWETVFIRWICASTLFMALADLIAITDKRYRHTWRSGTAPMHEVKYAPGAD
jgi:hypothetical protein